MKILLLNGLLAASLGAAEMKMTVEQLRAFIRSSRQLNHPDRQVSDYLKQVKLTERLDERTLEDLQGLGAGPKTLSSLKSLADSSVALPEPPKRVAPVRPQPIEPPPAAEQAQVLQDVTDYAMDYAKKLPNFICTQVTRRYADPSGLEFFNLQDTVTAKLTFFEQKEDYQVVLINNRYVSKKSIDQLGGATSTGEFGSMLKEIFEPESKTKFEWSRWATLRGKRMHVYTYRVPQQNSKWSIVWEKTDRIVPGYRGEIFVDRETLAITRVTLQAEDIPVSFPIQQARTVLDYEWQDIAGKEYMVPLRASVAMRAGKLLTRNDVEFRLYKRFGAEATITMTPEPLPESQVTEQSKP